MKMKSVWMGLVCLAGAAFAAPVDDIGALSVVGSEIRGENGQPAQLMGMSFYHGQHKAGRDFVKRSVIQHLAQDWRSSVVRIPMMWETEGGPYGGQGYSTDPVGSVKMVDSVVQAAIDVGIYVLVDWHEVNMINHQTQAVAFFTDIAQRWGTHKNVIYEVFNEPTSSSWSEIKTYAAAVIQAIRQHDPDNLIVVGTREWSQQVVEAADDPLKDQSGNLLPNVAYSLHFYASDNDHQKLRDRADSAMNKGIALFATEWGNSGSSGGGSLNTGYMDTFMNWMLSHKLSWCNWSLSDIPETSAALRNGYWNADGLISHSISTDGGWPDGDLSASGVFVRNKILANRPAYQPPGQSATIPNQTLRSLKCNVVRSGGDLEIRIRGEHSWETMQLLNMKGVIIATIRWTRGQEVARISGQSGFHGLGMLRAKDIDGRMATTSFAVVQ